MWIMAAPKLNPNEFGITIKAAKENFLDIKTLEKRVGIGRAKYLMRAGGKVRVTARRLIRAPRQRTLAEMDKKERQRYHIEMWKFKKGKRTKRPRRPAASSRPGEAPRNQTGILKQFIYFSLDQGGETVVVGPAKVTGGNEAPRVLEHGGLADTPRGGFQLIERRPYMSTALDNNAGQLEELWKDLVK
jgi:hypothetical protein